MLDQGLGMGWRPRLLAQRTSDEANNGLLELCEFDDNEELEENLMELTKAIKSLESR